MLTTVEMAIAVSIPGLVILQGRLSADVHHRKLGTWMELPVSIVDRVVYKTRSTRTVGGKQRIRLRAQLPTMHDFLVRLLRDATA